MASSPLVKLVAHHSLLTVSIDHRLPHDLVVFQGSLNPEDANSSAWTFSNVLAYVVHRFVPKTIRYKLSRPLWQIKALRKLKRIKRSALRRFVKHRTIPQKKATSPYSTVSARESASDDFLSISWIFSVSFDHNLNSFGNTWRKSARSHLNCHRQWHSAE